jgi:hypothetical protein
VRYLNCLFAAVENKRRGWGPPVDGREIAQAISRGNSNVSSSPALSTPTSRPRGLSSESSSRSDLDQLEHGMGLMVIDDDSQVRQRLESKRKSQLEVKNEAKEVLRKLREKQQQQGRNVKPRGMC